MREVATPSSALQEVATPSPALEYVLPEDFEDISETTYYFPSGTVFEVHDNRVPYFPGKSIYQDSTLTTYKGENLPHWQTSSVIYHVSFRLADSVPVAQQEEWLAERKRLADIAVLEHRVLVDDEKKRLQFLYSRKIEQFLDSGYGSCLLCDDKVADIVKQSLEFYNHQKYLLHAWCIMPNHVHIIFELLDGYAQSEILHGWKSYTAHAINKLLGRKGNLWQVDSYNHIIRTEAEYYNQVRYVWNNPVKAGFGRWKWRWMCLDDKIAPEEAQMKYREQQSDDGMVKGG